jgi:probable HAF family extracellular repeat protein
VPWSFYATASLNALGPVIGAADIGKGEAGSPSIRHAFLWDHGPMQDLGTLGGQNSEALAINDAGQIIGIAGEGEPLDRC